MPAAQDHTTQAIAERRAQLAAYRAVYAERYDRHLDPADHEAHDPLLARLEGRPVARLGAGHRHLKGHA